MFCRFKTRTSTNAVLALLVFLIPLSIPYIVIVEFVKKLFVFSNIPCLTFHYLNI